MFPHSDARGHDFAPGEEYIITNNIRRILMVYMISTSTITFERIIVATKKIVCGWMGQLLQLMPPFFWAQLHFLLSSSSSSPPVDYLTR